MIALLFVFVALGALLEVISLKRDPNKVVFDCTLSAVATEPGAPFEVRTIISNKGILPVSYLKIREGYPIMSEIPGGVVYEDGNSGRFVENVCAIGRRQRKTRAVTISIKKRGAHLFQGGTMEFGDFLGIREVSKTNEHRREILVYPKRLEHKWLTDALGSFCGDIEAQRFLIRDPVLTRGFREYTGREPMREIHWLQSARKGELIVREFDYTRQLSAAVILSTEGIDIFDADLMDECCSIARTVCEVLTEHGVYVSFFTNARLPNKNAYGVWQCEASTGRMGGLLEGLSRASSYTSCSLMTLLGFAAVESDPNNSFVVILPEGAKGSEEAVAEMRKSTGQEVLAIYSGLAVSG